MHAKFIAPARREFHKEVVYYNEQEPGLGVAFAQEVEEATARGSRIYRSRLSRYKKHQVGLRQAIHIFCSVSP